MTKRPTDHLEPAPKKRSGDRQISREEPPSDDDEEQEIGEGFARADNTAIKKRKIFKARRGASPAPVPASEEATAGGKAPASAGSNPFAGISLTPAAAASGNPFAGMSLPVQTAASKAPEPVAEARSAAQPHSAAAEPAPPSTSEPIGADVPVAEAAPAEHAPEEAGPEDAAQPGAAAAAAPAEQPQADRAKSSEAGSNAEAPAGTSGNAFASFAASNSKSAFGALSADAAAASNSFGNGSSLGASGFKSFSAAPSSSAPATTGFSFTPGASASFTFSTSSAPATSSFPAMTSIFQQSSQPSTSLFGSSSAAVAPAVSLPPEDANRVTGEEEERSVYTGDGVLFEYDEAERQWRERGRGEMKVNVGASGKARLIMRNKGNFRLLLNASIWPGMKVTPMDGGKGVTFIVMNAAQSTGDSKAGVEGKDGEGDAPEEGKMSTWAYRVKMEAKLAEFAAAVNEHRTPVSAAEDNV
ncbi:hypothetical protein CVIRNUC_007122 [Coccomyxa viridis]|uniref:RanBD1 domain-containing protein n=1 Tax=Coccomyxa viridis TaxID=1274662 RepID=A0AAV1IB51_9CHLO|nr:hypothetical protein CVIRNUC_007122 [Coccomyxa viridis]